MSFERTGLTLQGVIADAAGGRRLDEPATALQLAARQLAVAMYHDPQWEAVRATLPPAAIGWMRRLCAHPPVRDALAAGQVSESWARHICEWSDLLPERYRGDADEMLLEAAAAGLGLADLGALAEEMRRSLALPDRDGDGFEDRRVRLATTFGGARKLDGDLTPGCAAALQAVLDALGKRAGREDTRSKGQRAHDALEEACWWLAGSGVLGPTGPTHRLSSRWLERFCSLGSVAEVERARTH